ncbi:phosphatase PAP2 family protein [Streptomyces sp. BRB081]|uniref:phosphatase PAP2 family protein n=1 Tax=Streptomyces sp. BRB081 TaxID=2769544 RepID=UPI0018ACD88B|nr:phosphatase PAP2 family protein [Streptomyces sp. BRB081]MBL3805465.1 phosphatase PAP2 family protein [Streptomyces sp. BRB081]
MAGLETTGSNPDVGLLYDINGLAATSPDWVDRVVSFAGVYGLVLAVVLLTLWTWWRVRRTPDREEAAGAVAAVVWAPLAAGAALLVNIPIRGFVGRPRPAEQHRGVEELIGGTSDFSFVSDHATLAMALAVGLFIAHRRVGLVGIALAVLLGLSRVYLGVHYPTDVIGGLALGTAVALLLSPPASALLTPLTKLIARSAKAGRLVWSPKGPRGEAVPVEEEREGGRERQGDGVRQESGAVSVSRRRDRDLAA